MAALHQQVKTLKRELTMLKKARAKELVQAAKDHQAEVDELKDKLLDARDNVRRLERAKQDLEKELKSAEIGISGWRGVAEKIQAEMKTVCEAIYGQDFDPEWKGDAPETVWQDGIEYRRSDSIRPRPVYEDLLPEQRLLRMIWRRLHWGLNPLW